MKEIRVALIGVGGRGEGLYRVAMRKIQGLNFVALCDNKERCEFTATTMAKDGVPTPAFYEDYKQCIDEVKPDAVVIATSWEWHLPIATYAMEKGVAVACEVGGTYSIQSLWELVRCYEKTKTPIMFMENCCYGQIELLALNMKRKGLLGDIVHCEGGYRHDLRNEMASNPNHYRIYEYMKRNGDNYPTHEIGPIAKLLDINCGNRFLSLYSMSSPAKGLKTFATKEKLEWLDGVEYGQGDVVDTLIKCANGETVRISLDTTLPRFYSRDFTVQGTKGMISEVAKAVFLDDDFAEKKHYAQKDCEGNIDTYYEKYNHKLWKEYKPGEDGHGGMDYLVFDAFFTAIRKGEPMPIDVYDMATWMCITALSEASIATGQAVAFPDFTDGAWVRRKNHFCE